MGQVVEINITQYSDGKPVLPFKLSSREVDILRWISYGKQYSEIAELMNTTSNAINQQAYNILNKLGAHTAAGAVGIALRKGVIT
jgi:DNA-binding CsgD family transcriptional regulator